MGEAGETPGIGWLVISAGLEHKGCPWLSDAGPSDEDRGTVGLSVRAVYKVVG
jgi:hypothetical protein